MPSLTADAATTLTRMLGRLSPSLWDIDPTSDIHASAAYRRQLARVLTRRALETAFARCS